MKQFKKVEIEGEQLYLNKSKVFGWTVVYPVKNEDGTLNWKHFIAGRTWWNLIIIMMFIVLFFAAGYEYNQNMKECTKVMEWYNIQNAFNISLPDSPEIESMKQIPNLTRMLEGRER